MRPPHSEELMITLSIPAPTHTVASSPTRMRPAQLEDTQLSLNKPLLLHWDQPLPTLLELTPTVPPPLMRTSPAQATTLPQTVANTLPQPSKPQPVDMRPLPTTPSPPGQDLKPSKTPLPAEVPLIKPLELIKLPTPKTVDQSLTLKNSLQLEDTKPSLNQLQSLDTEVLLLITPLRPQATEPLNSLNSPTLSMEKLSPT